MCRRGCGGYASCRVRGGVVSLQRANMLGGRRSSLLLRKRACPRLRRLLRILLEVSAKGRWQRGLAKVLVVLVAGRDGVVIRELKQVGDEVAVAGGDRALLTQHNQLDLALYAFANDLFDADVFFYDKAAHSGLFREPIADARRLFCGFNKAPPPVDEAAGDDEADGYGEDPPVR